MFLVNQATFLSKSFGKFYIQVNKYIVTGIVSSLLLVSAHASQAKSKPLTDANIAAMDVVKESHIMAYSKITDFKGSSSFLTWLYSIPRNEALMYLRKHKKERGMNIVDIHLLAKEKSDEKDEHHISCQDALSEKILENQELKKLINNQLDSLPDDFRVVFVLRAIDQLSVRETAEVLALNEKTVKTRYFRAKKLIREKILVYLDLVGMDVYEFGGEHCDIAVHNVLTSFRQDL